MRSETRKMCNLVARNIKLYFKDKLTFFVSLITPLILVFLFLAFLRGVYEDSLLQTLKVETLDGKLMNGFTGGWLFSSILSTSCITVAFCSGMMVYDKINKVNVDFQVVPVKKSTVQLSYVIANFFTTFIVCFVLFVISLIYLAIVGWYIAFVDVLLILADMILTILFGCLLSNIIFRFANSQGALSGVCTLVSSMYGFICGAYMPLHSMGAGIQGFASFLPGTYSTILFRQAYMNGVVGKIAPGFAPEHIAGLREGFDCEFSFFGIALSPAAMYVILTLSVLIFLGVYILIANIKIKPKKNKSVKTK